MAGLVLRDGSESKVGAWMRRKVVWIDKPFRRGGNVRNWIRDYSDEADRDARQRSVMIHRNATGLVEVMQLTVLSEFSTEVYFALQTEEQRQWMTGV